MARTKFDIISQAMTLLDADEVEAWGTSNPSREEEVSQQLYELAKKSELTIRNWNFAQSTAVLSKDVATPTDPNWTYQYTPPSDNLLILNIINTAGASVSYTNENNKIYTNTDTVYAKYLKDIDENDMPWHFVDLLVARLALDFAESLVSENTVLQRRANHYNAKFRVAARLDTHSNPPVEIYKETPNSWSVTAQGSGYLISGR